MNSFTSLHHRPRPRAFSHLKARQKQIEPIIKLLTRSKLDTQYTDVWSVSDIIHAFWQQDKEKRKGRVLFKQLICISVQKGWSIRKKTCQDPFKAASKSIQFWLTCGQNSMYSVAQYDGSSLQVQFVEHDCSGLGWQSLSWPRFHEIHQLQQVVWAIQTGRSNDLRHTGSCWSCVGRIEKVCTLFVCVLVCTCTLLLPILVALLHRRLLTPIPSPSPTSSANRLSILAWNVLSFTRWSNTPSKTKGNAHKKENVNIFKFPSQTYGLV